MKSTKSKENMLSMRGFLFCLRSAIISTHYLFPTCKLFFRLNARMFESKAETYKRIEATNQILHKQKSDYWRQETQRRKFQVVTDSRSAFYTTAMDELTDNLLTNKPFIDSSLRQNAYGAVFFVALKDLTLYAVFKTESSDFNYVPLFDAPIKLLDNSKIMVTSFVLLLL